MTKLVAAPAAASQSSPLPNSLALFDVKELTDSMTHSTVENSETWSMADDLDDTSTSTPNSEDLPKTAHDVIVEERHAEVSDPASASQRTSVEEDSKVVAEPARAEKTRSEDEAPLLRPRRSILRRSESVEEIPVCLKRCSYRNLPPPDMKSIRRTQSLPVETTQARSVQRRRSVGFGNVEIRNYDQTLGDNPSVSYGPPISLDWSYETMDPVTVDSYEECRGRRRGLREMVLSYYNRKNVLSWAYGVSEEDLKKAESRANKSKFQRGVTRYFLPVSKVEDFVTSAGRKAKRVVTGRRKSAPL